MATPGRHFRQPDAGAGSLPSPKLAAASRSPAAAARDGRGGGGDQDGRLSKSRRGRRRRGNILPVLLIVAGVALLLVAGGLFIKAQVGYSQAKDAYGELEQYAVADDAGDGVPTVDFDALARINPDIVGWIYVPGTVINYPVVQTDNNTTYLTKMFDGQNNGNGAIFMDMDDTAPGVVDEQTTLYGHHMYDASMFNIIDKSRDQSVFDTFTDVYYITRKATYRFKPLFTTQVADSFAQARQANFTGDATLAQYLTSTLEQASAKAAEARDRCANAKQVLALVTCNAQIVPTDQRALMACSLEETIARQ